MFTFKLILLIYFFLFVLRYYFITMSGPIFLCRPCQFIFVGIVQHPGFFVCRCTNFTLNLRVEKRVSGNATIFSAELIAIFEALLHVRSRIQNHPNQDFIVFSESAAALAAIKSGSSRAPVVIRIQEILRDFPVSVRVVFVRAPARF